MPRAIPVFTLAIVLAASGLALPPASTLAAEQGEIERAVQVAGARDSQACECTTICSRLCRRSGWSEAACRAVPACVMAAVKMRPDLAKEITLAALLARAAPGEKAAILQAASAKMHQLTFLAFSVADNTGFFFSAATRSPANTSDLRDSGSVNSPEQPPSQ
ncbi:MAG: hypothetical protein DLM73_02010 [Chthoniobacterales bacterium]|nr:MAG: hypothetical protein DLM73_02010 [Chthoniobacterales bacterium]